MDILSNPLTSGIIHGTNLVNPPETKAIRIPFFGSRFFQLLYSSVVFSIPESRYSRPRLFRFQEVCMVFPPAHESHPVWVFPGSSRVGLLGLACSSAAFISYGATDCEDARTSVDPALLTVFPIMYLIDDGKLAGHCPMAWVST